MGFGKGVGAYTKSTRRVKHGNGKRKVKRATNKKLLNSLKENKKHKAIESSITNIPPPQDSGENINLIYKTN
jgi:hypothetical protein